MSDSEKSNDLHGRMARAEATIEQVHATHREMVPELRNLNRTIGELLSQVVAVKDHEERLRDLETARSRADGVIGLVKWIGFPTAAGTILAVGYLFLKG